MRPTTDKTAVGPNMGSPESPLTPLLIGADELAALLRISTRSLWRLLSAGRLPKPIRLGRSVRWRRVEVEIWINCGCPAVRGDLNEEAEDPDT